MVTGCQLPILGLGGYATPHPLDSLALAEKIITSGARGVDYGRNAIQRPDPKAYQRPSCDVIKLGMSPKKAVEKYHRL